MGIILTLEQVSDIHFFTADLHT